MFDKKPSLAERIEALGREREKRASQKELEALRDKFAMAALAGLLADGSSDAELMAAISYKIADAMLEARKK